MGGVEVQGSIDVGELSIDERERASRGNLNDDREQVGEQDRPDRVFAGGDETRKGTPVAEPEPCHDEQEGGPTAGELGESVKLDFAGEQKIKEEQGHYEQRHCGVKAGSAPLEGDPCGGVLRGVLSFCKAQAGHRELYGNASDGSDQCDVWGRGRGTTLSAFGKDKECLGVTSK